MTQTVKVQVAENGRIVLPAGLRKAAGIRPGEAVLIELDGNELRIRSQRSAVQRIQQRWSAIAKEGALLSDELIAERRAEASRELG